MQLSKQAIQADIEKLRREYDKVGAASENFKVEIEKLETEKRELLTIISIQEAGGEARGLPTYDLKALKANVTHLDENIGEIKKVVKWQDKEQERALQMIATLEVKRDTEGF